MLPVGVVGVAGALGFVVANAAVLLGAARLEQAMPAIAASAAMVGLALWLGPRAKVT